MCDTPKTPNNSSSKRQQADPKPPQSPKDRSSKNGCFVGNGWRRKGDTASGTPPLRRKGK